MGLKLFDINLLKDTLEKNGLQYNGLKMLQLGDQIIRIDGKVRAKAYFESLGAFVFSIDINGKGGSVPIDLSKPIDMPEYNSYFDIITNCGTSEHVSDHIQCFANMDYFCKQNGLIYNLVPREGFWYNRSHRDVHRYNNYFFEKWANDNGYLVLVNRIVTREEYCSDDLILSILKKK
jgi:hypothetical protein